MEICSPVYRSSDETYCFELKNVEGSFSFKSCPQFLETSSVTFPDSPLPAGWKNSCELLVEAFVEKSKKWFATPLRKDSVLKKLTPVFLPFQLPAEVLPAWIQTTWVPAQFRVKREAFFLDWRATEHHPAEPLIPQEFLGAPTPRAQSPVLPSVAAGAPGPAAPSNLQADVKQIHIQNTIEYPEFPQYQADIDSLIPIGDLPLSEGGVDFPDLAETPERAAERRRIREARMRAALAKLKAERLASRYYSRYGSQPTSDSSDLSDSEDSSESS